MYISSLFIRNFKSLQKVKLRFREGKNVILGKNNSGKSNVIGALDLLFNERSPVYKNFDQNDFFTKQLVDKDTGEITEVIAPYFFISATIAGRDFDEGGILSIKKSIALSKLKSRNCIIENGEVDYEMLTSLDEIAQCDKVVEVSYEATKKTGGTYSVKNKKERWFIAQELLTFLKSANRLDVFFCKSAATGDCGFGLLVLDSENHLWVTHFLNNKLRDSLITTAIVPAFRSPKDQLRLTHYSWYGKLIKRLWDNGKGEAEAEILEKTNDIKNLADKVFGKSTFELRELLKKAIAHEEVSFKLVNNKGHELYKTVSIHVDDGIDRPIDCKGSGIQSAIIISLFTTYCAEFHNSSSLLIAEEPELFLHPQARRVMSNELEKFLECNDYQRRQLIISTHSTEFIRNTNLENISILRKNKEQNHTREYQFELGDLEPDEIQKIVRFIWSKNAEVLFADKALLVEGGEEYLMPAIANVSRGEKQFLDYRNISVARVDGKGNFITYIKILDKLGIQ